SKNQPFSLHHWRNRSICSFSERYSSTPSSGAESARYSIPSSETSGELIDRQELLFRGLAQRLEAHLARGGLAFADDDGIRGAALVGPPQLCFEPCGGNAARDLQPRHERAKLLGHGESAPTR